MRSNNDSTYSKEHGESNKENTKNTKNINHQWEYSSKFFEDDHFNFLLSFDQNRTIDWYLSTRPFRHFSTVFSFYGLLNRMSLSRYQTIYAFQYRICFLGFFFKKHTRYQNTEGVRQQGIVSSRYQGTICVVSVLFLLLLLCFVFSF